MSPELVRAVEAALRARVRGVAPVRGGDIARSHRLELDDGRRVFVKSLEAAPSGFFEVEARGLAWLAEPGVVPLPRVLGVGAKPAFLALEWLDAAQPGPRHDEVLGRGLARLHRAGAPCFGAEQDGYLGTLPLDHSPAPSAAAQLERRLLSLAALGNLPSSTRRRLERVVARLPDLVPEEPPQRLHGDLWAGNVLTGPGGVAYLIDPAAHGGPRELDLAMMRLFGGFGPGVFAAYEEEYPLQPGALERVPLFQAVPLLAHYCLFGPSWLPRVEAALARYAG